MSGPSRESLLRNGFTGLLREGGLAAPAPAYAPPSNTARAFKNQVAERAAAAAAAAEQAAAMNAAEKERIAREFKATVEAKLAAKGGKRKARKTYRRRQNKRKSRRYHK